MRRNTVRVAWIDKEASRNSAKSPGCLATLAASHCILALLSGGANAQGAGEAIQLGEVVVDGPKKGKDIPTNGPTGIKGYTAEAASVGTKTNTPLNKVPQSISVVTRENLDDRNVQDLNSALAYTPGAQTNIFGYDPRYEDVYIRGFDTIYNGVYRDGLRDYNAAGAGAIFRNEPYTLQSIAVLRGPSGATYGFGSPGGIVDLTSKRATFTKFGEVQLQVGNFDRKQGDFDFGDVVPGTDGKFAYRVTGVVRDANTFPSGPDSRFDIAPTFTYAPDGATSFTFLSGYDRVKVPGTVAFYNTANFNVTNLMFGDPAYNKLAQDQWRIGYAFEHHYAPDLIFRQNVRYAALGLSWRYTQIDSIDPSGQFANRSNGLLYERQGAITVDNQVEKRFMLGPTHHVLLGGLDFAHADFAVRSGFGAIAPLNLQTLNYGQQFIPDPPLSNILSYRQSQTQFGQYLQDQVDWGPATLTLSGRHDSVQTGTDDDAAPGQPQNSSDDAYTYRAGLNYKVTPFVVPYASYATTFAPNLGVGAGGTPFPVQRGDQKEAGVKTQLPNTNLHFNGAYFDIVQSSVLRTDPNNPALQAATGKVRSRGFELEAIDNIAPGTNFVASFTHLDLRFIDGDPTQIGNRLSGIPGDTVAGFVNYTLPVPGALRGLNIGGGIRYFGFSYADDANTAANRPATVFDAVVGYEFAALSQSLKGLRAQFNGYNIFDRYYTTCQAGFCYRGAPLQVIGSLIYRW